MLDALVIPGGWCPDYLRRDKRFVDLVRNMVTASKYICAGSVIWYYYYYRVLRAICCQPVDGSLIGFM